MRQMGCPACAGKSWAQYLGTPPNRSPKTGHGWRTGGRWHPRSSWCFAGPLEVGAAGAAQCQDSYQDWISLYCWAPFHTPEGSHCSWDRIRRRAGISPAVPSVRLERGPCRGGRVPVPGWPHSGLSTASALSSTAAPRCWLSCSALGLLLSSTPSWRFTPNASPSSWGQTPPRLSRLPWAGHSCGCAAQLPHGPCGCSQSSLEMSSNPCGHLPSPCLPSGL